MIYTNMNNNLYCNDELMKELPLIIYYEKEILSNKVEIFLVRTGLDGKDYIVKNYYSRKNVKNKEYLQKLFVELGLPSLDNDRVQKNMIVLDNLKGVNLDKLCEVLNKYTLTSLSDSKYLDNLNEFIF